MRLIGVVVGTLGAWAVCRPKEDVNDTGDRAYSTVPESTTGTTVWVWPSYPEPGETAQSTGTDSGYGGETATPTVDTGCSGQATHTGALDTGPAQADTGCPPQDTAGSPLSETGDSSNP